MKILYKYRLKKSLFFLIFITINSLDSMSQTYVIWNPAVNANGVSGVYPGGVVTATLAGLGNALSFDSPAPSDNNLVFTGDRTFSTTGPSNNPPAQSLTFNFSMPVVITTLNVADIDRRNGGWDDSFNFGGVVFANTNSTNCNSALNGATATTAIVFGFGNEEFATWVNSCNLINSFTINYLRPDDLTTAYLAYSMEVCAPFNGVNLGPFCVNSAAALPTTIACGITGVWSPATVNTSVAGTFNYTFTPDAGQVITCPLTTSVTINECCLPVLTSATTITTMVQEERSDWIKSTDIINFGDGVAGNGVIYHAGNFVELNPGFETGTAAQFSAYPQDCSGNYVYRPQANPKSNMQDIINSIKQNFVINKSQGFIEAHIGKADILNSVLIYPTPAKNVVEIAMKNTKFKKVCIMTIDGKKMYEKSFGSTNKFQLDVSNYANGIYIVNITADNGHSFSEKLIKN